MIQTAYIIEFVAFTKAVEYRMIRNITNFEYSPPFQRAKKETQGVGDRGRKKFEEIKLRSNNDSKNPSVTPVSASSRTQPFPPHHANIQVSSIQRYSKYKKHV